MAPAIRLDRPTGQRRPGRNDVLPSHDQAKVVETAERAQVERRVAALGHVEVF